VLARYSLLATGHKYNTKRRKITKRERKAKKTKRQNIENVQNVKIKPTEINKE
jgi:hypothetical protein